MLQKPGNTRNERSTAVENEEFQRLVLEKLGSMEKRMDSMESHIGSMEKRMDSMEGDIKELKAGQDILREGQIMLQKRVNSMELKIDHLGFDMAQVLYNATTAVDEALLHKQEKES